MFSNADTKKAVGIIAVIIILLLSFLIIRPIILSIIGGLILAYIFIPVYKKLNSLLHSRNISALLICIFALLILFIPLWFLTPLFVKQTFDIYSYSQQIDILTPLRKIFPTIFSSEELSKNILLAFSSFIGKISNSLLSFFTNLLINFPIILLHLAIILFIFFFAVRDNQKIAEYVKSLSPLSKESANEFFRQSKAITSAILYGQVLVGIIQGAVMGILLFILKIPNALLLTALTIFAGIFPIVGATIVWIPVSIYLFVIGNTWQGVLIVIGGIILSWGETFFKPLFVSKRTKISSPIILIGMIGGLFVFGLAGMLIGPLILSYLLIILDFYRKKKFMLK